jgi:hypothetical protein
MTLTTTLTITLTATLKRHAPIALSMLAIAGCTKSAALNTATSGSAPFISKVTSSQILDPCKPSATSASQCTQAVQLTMALPKAATLGREFMYNLDLQYSSVYDPGMDLYSQTQAAASVPVHFARVGNELQLLSIGSIKYPSDVNHPDELIARFTILSENDSEFEVSTANSADYLAEQLGPAPSSTTNDTKNIGYLDYWVRSAETAQDGALYLQQSSLQAKDGTITEFMESIFPRDVIAPGAQFTKIKMDPTNPTGGTTGLAARFRFLQGDTVFTGEDKHSYAQHFDISGGKTIDWYVTQNAPDSVLPILKTGVEGWNRYFSRMKGIERNVMSFKGKLPDGIHIGDPRYNVIGWDDRLVAGAAYESQDSDPESGVQTHSLIYMPAAWLKIGTDYWATGQYSDGSAGDPTATQSHTSPSKLSLKNICARDLSDATAVMASGRFNPEETAAFSEQLLKQVLFHEVGHALGLAHNFKGSTEFDLTQPNTIFSSSIMDYNDYSLERAAFSALDSSDGPLLEYDRQILSEIYNNGQDIAASDRVMPACNDAEADNLTGGVDPICIRYDIGHDPTLQVQVTGARITEAKIDKDVTLQDAISRIPDLYLSDAKIATLTSEDALKAAATGFAKTLAGSEGFYLGSSGLGGNVRLNVKSLYEFGGAPLPGDYDAAAMRERVFTGVNQVVTLMTMPAGVKDALAAAEEQGLAKLATSPYMIRMASSTKTGLLKTLSDQITATVAAWETDTKAGLPATRAKVIATLDRQTAVPYYLGSAKDGSLTNYESSMVGVLGDVVTGKLKQTSVERIAAAKALATYSGRPAYTAAIGALQNSLNNEVKNATTNDTLETALSVLGALSGGSS